MLMETCDWLKVTSASGMWQILKRLRIRYKRARDYVHSPDPVYVDKVNYINIVRVKVEAEPERFTFLYLDELTYYRQPSLAQAYAPAGVEQPLARRSYRSDTAFRVLGALNALTGQVTYCQRSKTNIKCLSDFWFQLCSVYPNAETIYVVLDNWPVHFHPDVLAPLMPQYLPWEPTLPPNWPSEPSQKARHDNLPIQLVCLPTYASWLNPIEKLWRWLKQDVLHLHSFADAWPQLKQEVAQFLDQFREPAPDLLRYTGLSPN
jgi:hypothetical protein